MSEFNVANSPLAYSPSNKENPVEASLKQLATVRLAEQATDIDPLEKQPVTEKETSSSEKESTDTEQDITDTIDEMNRFLESMKRNISFSIDEESGQSIILVKDSENDQIIRQLPSEELIVLRKKMDDVAGILFDTKV
jgi:flagellar protein FlaG